MWPRWRSQTPWKKKRKGKKNRVNSHVKLLSNHLWSDATCGNKLVCCEFLTDESSWDLSHNVSPEERAVDHSHSLRIPVELSFLFWTANNTESRLDESIKDEGRSACSFSSTHHHHLFVVSVGGVAVDHADDGHAQVTPNPERDAETDAREDGDDVAPRQAEARAVHHGQLFLRHCLWPSLCWELDGLSIFLFLLKDSAHGAEKGKCKEPWW